MSITLTNGLTTIELHPDLLWSDEYNWHPVEQSVQRTITGAQVVSLAQKVAGRPITLEAEADDSAWMRRSVVETLRNWAAVAGQELVLTLRGVARDVIFRHHDGAGFEAEPVVHYSEMDDDDFYRCTLRFMEI